MFLLGKIIKYYLNKIIIIITKSIFFLLNLKLKVYFKKMGFFVKAEKQDATQKYGFHQHGMFALEPIKKGQPIFTCDLSKCDYLKLENVKSGRTREETLAIFERYPQAKDFIHRYQYMIDDDTYDWPRNWASTQDLTEDCMFFNHSCEPNCGFAALDSSLVVAIRDIQTGEELTYDYQFMDTEPSFYDGINCRCGSSICRGVLKFDNYRNVDWQNKFYKYCGIYVKKRIDELANKWFSSQCYLKYYKTNDQEQVLGLTSLYKISKDELVAKYSTQISLDSHYIRHSDQPTCYLDGNQVYTLREIEPHTELTIKFSS